MTQGPAVIAPLPDKALLWGVANHHPKGQSKLGSSHSTGSLQYQSMKAAITKRFNVRGLLMAHAFPRDSYGSTDEQSSSLLGS